ncbi:MAG: TolC family outer membrane protein [Rhodobacteraceae bacterium]|nr:TolC family outer membrane protein [Paracoccaceae bacterium]
MTGIVWTQPFRTLATAALAVVLVSPGATKAQNLADALVGAYNTSDLMEQNRALLRAADEDVAIALSALRPILNWTGSVGRQYTNSITGSSNPVNLGLTASLLIYDGGASRLGIARTKETVLATRQALISVEQSILLRAVSAYFGVIEATETVDLRQNNVRVLAEELRAAEDRFEVGEVTRTDVAQAESRLAEARSLLATAQGDFVAAQEEYLSAVGSRPGQLTSPPSLPKPPASIDSAKAIAVRNHPDVRQAQHQVAANDIAVEEARSGWLPTVDLSASASWSEDLADDDPEGRSAAISLNYTQPIYQGGRIAATVRRAMATRNSARANLLTVTEDIEQQAANALIVLRSAEASLAATMTRIEAARVAFEGVREEATLGARTTLDVLDAEQELLDAQAARISAEADRAIAAYVLVSAQGLLTAENLRLAVTLYDPTAYYNSVKNAPAYYSQQGRDLDRVLRAIGKD